MNKYLNYYRENKLYPWEKPPIGIIICEHSGKEEVHYALGGLQNKIFVAEYRTKLPSEQEIQERLQQIRQPNLLAKISPVLQEVEKSFLTYRCTGSAGSKIYGKRSHKNRENKLIVQN